MPQFQFNLEPVLKTRKAAEQHHQRIVATLETKRRELEERLIRLQRAIEEGRLGLRHQLSGPLAMADLRAQAGSVTHARRGADAIARELGVLMKQMDDARAKLRDAMARRRAIELLKERRLHEWTLQMNRVEQAAMDELAVINAARREMHS